MPWHWHRSVRVLKTWDAIGLVAVRKPQNVLCIPSVVGVSSVGGKKNNKVKSILPDMPYDYDGEHFTALDGSRLWLLHRLDLGTSGVLLLTTRQATAKRIKMLFKNRQVTKTYKAVVFSQPHNPALVAGQEWRDYLDQKGEIKLASTVLESAVPVGDNLHLLTLQPRTGFQHQLRKQCSLRKLPIVDDDRHGDFASNRAKNFPGKRLLLHSEKVSFTLQGTYYEAISPLEAESNFLPNFAKKSVQTET